MRGRRAGGLAWALGAALSVLVSVVSSPTLLSFDLEAAEAQGAGFTDTLLAEPAALAGAAEGIGTVFGAPG